MAKPVWEKAMDEAKRIEQDAETDADKTLTELAQSKKTARIIGGGVLAGIVVFVIFWLILG